MRGCFLEMLIKYDMILDQTYAPKGCSCWRQNKKDEHAHIGQPVSAVLLRTSKTHTNTQEFALLRAVGKGDGYVLSV